MVYMFILLMATACGWKETSSGTKSDAKLLLINRGEQPMTPMPVPTGTIYTAGPHSTPGVCKCGVEPCPDPLEGRRCTSCKIVRNQYGTYCEGTYDPSSATINPPTPSPNATKTVSPVPQTPVPTPTPTPTPNCDQKEFNDCLGDALDVYNNTNCSNALDKNKCELDRKCKWEHASQDCVDAYVMRCPSWHRTDEISEECKVRAQPLIK